MPKYPYKKLGVDFDEVYRNDLNQALENIEDDFKNVQGQVNNLVIEGDSSPAAAQAAIGEDGFNYGSLKVRLDEEYKNLFTQLLEKASTSYVNAIIDGVVSGAPRGVYSTVTALTTAFPSGNNNIYIVSENGNWYYWSGSAWTAGGQYLSSNSDLLKTTFQSGYISNTGAITAPNVSYEYTPSSVVVTKGTKVLIHACGSNGVAIVSKWTKEGTFKSAPIIGDGASVTRDWEYTATDDVEYLRFTNNITSSGIPVGQAYAKVITTNAENMAPVYSDIKNIISDIENNRAEILRIRSGKIDYVNNTGFVASENHSTLNAGDIATGTTSYTYTDIFQLKKGDELVITASGSPNVYVLSEWTASGAFIEGKIIGDDRSGVVTYNYIVTKDVEYLRVTNGLGYVSSENFFIGLLNNSLAELEGDITAINQSIAAIENDIAVVRSGSQKTLQLVWNSGFIASANHPTLAEGETTTGATYNYTGLIRVAKGDKIKFNAATSQNAVILSKWTAEGAFLKSIIVGIDSNFNEHEYIAQDTTEYLRICNNYSYYPIEQVVATLTVTSIRDLENRVEALELDVSQIGTGGSQVIVEGFGPQAVRLPAINFIFDDGLASDLDVAELFKNYGYTCGFALVSGNNNNYTLYNSLQEQGFEVLSHSITHSNIFAGDGKTLAEMEPEFRDSKATLEAQGLKIAGWVTPMSQMNSKYIELLGKYYEFAFTDYLGRWDNTFTENPCNTLADDTRVLKRVSLESSDLTGIQQAIDKVVADGGLLTFYAHGYPATNLPSEKLIAVLDYAKTKTDLGACKVLAPTEAYKHYYTLRHSDIKHLFQ